MFSEMKKRKYTLKLRAEQQQATRERIVEAAMQLHGEIGPRETTISAIADRAGVQRLTVYRHFSDDTELFGACSTRWLEQNPPPDPAGWRHAPTRRDKTVTALTAFYEYYERTAYMWSLVYRDAELESLREPLTAFEAFLDETGAELASFWRPQGRRPKRLDATIRHAIHFTTWSSLSRQGLSAAAAARTAAGWIEAMAG